MRPGGPKPVIYDRKFETKFYDGNTWFELDKQINRAYYLDEGGVNTPEGKLVKRRISIKVFNETLEKVKLIAE